MGEEGERDGFGQEDGKDRRGTVRACDGRFHPRLDRLGLGPGRIELPQPHRRS